ncbi:MAG: HgcAB-like fusion protein [Myxococcota bacterium]
MIRARGLWVEVVQTLLRMLPWPCRTGVVSIGSPGRDAPVLLTGNFRLSVERVRRALEGMDAYLLVANSRGVNVWCAATGGLLTNHDVVSVLKTSGIAELVDHRRVVLPQLAATGIEGPVVQRKTGWKVDWGPVEAEDIRAFLARGREASRAMRTVRFPWRQRLEMAVAWAFPISILALPLAPIWAEGALSIAALVWGLSLLTFLAFPLGERLAGGAEAKTGFGLSRLGERGLPLLLWLALMAALALCVGLDEQPGWGALGRWGLLSFAVLLVLGLDLTGSTPVYKSGLHEDRLLRISLDAGACKGVGFCEQVCPKDVFEVDAERRLAALPRADACVQCGACIVQCPFDALSFEDASGGVVTPETVRRFKLNLMGHRRVSDARARNGSGASGTPPAST